MDAIEKTGISVELIGGENALATARALRQELQTIASLGKGPGTLGSSTSLDSELKSREKARTESAKKISDAEIFLQKKTTAEELDILARAKNKRDDLSRQVAQRADTLRREELAKEKAHQAELARLHQQSLEQRKRRVEAYSKIDGIEGRDLTSQRRSFRRYRNDEARDEQTNVFRRQLSEEIQGQRLALRERAKLQREEEALNKQRDTERQRERDRQRKAEIERRSYDPAVLRRNLDARSVSQLPSALRGDIELDLEAQRLARRRADDARELQNIQAERQRKSEERRALAEQRRVGDDAVTRRLLTEDAEVKLKEKALLTSARTTAGSNLQAQQADSAVNVYRDISNRRAQAGQDLRETIALRNSVANNNGPLASLQAVERQLEKDIRLYRQLAAAENSYLSGSGGGGTGGGPGGPRGPRGPRRGRPTFGDPDAVQNPSGFFTSFDAVSRITRNILLYEVVSQASYGLTTYIATSITAAKQTIEYANALRFATEAAGGNVQANLTLADSLGNIGLSRQQGRAAVVEAARFAESRPQDTEALTRVVADIAAQRGDGIDRTDELIEQLRRRESKFYKRIFGKTVESIYRDEAARSIDSQTTSIENNRSLYVGLDATEYKSREDRIASYVAAMDDAAKEGAVLNYILSQQNKFAGEADIRATTLAGRLDKLSAAFLNGKEGLGLFITDLKIFTTITDTLTAKAGLLDKLRPEALGRSGLGGTISEYDVNKFGTSNTYNERAQTIRTVDNLLPTALIAGAGALGFGLLGRKQALANAQQKTYDSVLETTTTKFRGDLSAATNEAIFKAQNTRATMAQQISTGISRVTTAVSARVNDVLYYAANAVGADRTASRAAARAASLRGELGVNGTVASRLNVSENLLGTSQMAGGVLGGYAGAVIGSFVAERITSNQIIATGITILGGVAGTAAGTALGTAAAGFAGTKLAGIGGAATLGVPAALLASVLSIGVAGGNLVERFATGSFGGGSGRTASEAELATQAEGRRFEAYRLRVQERNRLNADDRIRYRSLAAGDTAQFLTGEEVRLRGDAVGDGRGGFKNYVEEILPPLTELQKKISEVRRERDKLVKNVSDNPTLPQNIKDVQIDRLNKEFEAQAFAIRNPEWKKYHDEYLAKQAESINKRLAKDRDANTKQLNEYVSQAGNALSKLRDATQGSFRLVGDIGTLVVGEDNQYVKALSDQITVAQRMQQQWGFLGKAAVDYFTALEAGSIKRQLNRLDFASYTQSSNLRGQAQRELAERGSSGLGRRENDYLDIQSAIVDKAVEIPKLWTQAAEVLGQTINPLANLQSRIAGLQIASGVGAARSGIYGQRFAGFNAGEQQTLLQNPDGTFSQLTLNAGRSDDYIRYAAQAREIAQQSPEVRGRIQEQYADAALGIFGEFTPEQIRRSGLAPTYLQAIRTKAGGLDRRIFEATEKARFGVLEDTRLQAQLQQDQEFRERQIRAGYDPKDVGRESDALLLSRTDGVSPKDLTLSQFTARQDALRRQAERTEADRREAQDAVQKGLEYQAAMAESIEAIRSAILSGDVSMLIQVQNDTQARIDQESLQELSSGNYNIGLDQGEVKTNPYSGSFDKYGRGGRKK